MLTRNSKLHTDVKTSNIEHVQQIQQQKATGKQSSPSSTPLSKKKEIKKKQKEAAQHCYQCSTTRTWSSTMSLFMVEHQNEPKKNLKHSTISK